MIETNSSRRWTGGLVRVAVLPVESNQSVCLKRIIAGTAISTQIPLSCRKEEVLEETIDNRKEKCSGVCIRTPMAIIEQEEYGRDVYNSLDKPRS